MIAPGTEGGSPHHCRASQGPGFARPEPQACAAEGAEFLSQKGCKKCHFKQAKSWKKTVHAKAMDNLKPGAAAEPRLVGPAPGVHRPGHPLFEGAGDPEVLAGWKWTQPIQHS